MMVMVAVVMMDDCGDGDGDSTVDAVFTCMAEAAGLERLYGFTPTVSAPDKNNKNNKNNENNENKKCNKSTKNNEFNKNNQNNQNSQNSQNSQNCQNCQNKNNEISCGVAVTEPSLVKGDEEFQRLRRTVGGALLPGTNKSTVSGHVDAMR